MNSVYVLESVASTSTHKGPYIVPVLRPWPVVHENVFMDEVISVYPIVPASVTLLDKPRVMAKVAPYGLATCMPRPVTSTVDTVADTPDGFAARTPPFIGISSMTVATLPVARVSPMASRSQASTPSVPRVPQELQPRVVLNRLESTRGGQIRHAKLVIPQPVFGGRIPHRKVVYYPRCMSERYINSSSESSDDESDAPWAPVGRKRPSTTQPGGGRRKRPNRHYVF